MTKKRTPTRGKKPATRKAKGQSATAKRRPRVSVPVAPTVDEDEGVFIPPGFQFPLELKPLTLPRDIDAALNESFNYSPRLSPGFDARGNCAHGCNGMVSLKDPMLGMHELSCPFWDSQEGIRLMLSFEHSDIPPIK